MNKPEPPSLKIRLTKSDVKGWRVTYGAHVLFTGTRPQAKKAAAQAAREKGLRSWENQKARGVFVTIPL